MRPTSFFDSAGKTYQQSRISHWDAIARKRLIDIGTEIPDKPDRTPTALQRFIESEVERWSAVLKSAS